MLAKGKSQMDDTPQLGFGNYFTPHMVITTWSADTGWLPNKVVRHDVLRVSPAALALHYGQAIFEGLKAYARADDAASIFMPWANAARFNQSAQRLAMPSLPEGQFISACEALVLADLPYLPRRPGQSLYLRPFMLATEPCLAVRPSRQYLFAVIASPVDSYFSTGQRPISVWCPAEHVRAFPGGTGSAKYAGNYAGGLVARADAAENGCDEVLWLDAMERAWVEELGAMNVFCVMTNADGKAELVTPSLSGTILAGVTRRAVLRLADARGFEVSERPLRIDEIMAANSVVTEVFACGTAAVIAAVGSVASSAGRRQIGDGGIGPVTARLRAELVGIQEGRQEDEFGWMHDMRDGGRHPGARAPVPDAVSIPDLPASLMAHPNA